MAQNEVRFLNHKYGQKEKGTKNPVRDPSPANRERQVLVWMDVFTVYMHSLEQSVFSELHQKHMDTCHS